MYKPRCSWLLVSIFIIPWEKGWSQIFGKKIGENFGEKNEILISVRNFIIFVLIFYLGEKMFQTRFGRRSSSCTFLENTPGYFLCIMLIRLKNFETVAIATLQDLSPVIYFIVSRESSTAFSVPGLDKGYCPPCADMGVKPLKEGNFYYEKLCYFDKRGRRAGARFGAL